MANKELTDKQLILSALYYMISGIKKERKQVLSNKFQDPFKRKKLYSINQDIERTEKLIEKIEEKEIVI